MLRIYHLLAVVIGVVMATGSGDAALAQKRGGVLRVPVFDNPASVSIHEESTVIAQRAMMGVGTAVEKSSTVAAG
jgi:hypothetical protein